MPVHLLLAAASVAAHLLFFVGAAFLAADLAVLPRVFEAEIKGDWRRLVPYAAETLAGWWPLLVIGASAAIAAAWLLLRTGFRARWFLVATRVSAWLWLPLVPPGPVVGLALLRVLAKSGPGKKM